MNMALLGTLRCEVDGTKLQNLEPGDEMVESYWMTIAASRGSLEPRLARLNVYRICRTTAVSQRATCECLDIGTIALCRVVLYALSTNTA